MSDSDLEFNLEDDYDNQIKEIDIKKGKKTKELLIVESPKKTSKIASFLGPSFIVKSTKGHIRNLVKKGLGVDVKNNFTPEFEVTDNDHKRIIVDLKKSLSSCHTVWLATDYDREGEGIAWHVMKVLGLDDKKCKIKVHRIIFTEITKKAILKAIANPQKLDQHMVYSQQSRQILDKLIGYRVSSTLHHKFKNYHLSAGRVQSVAVKLIMERENEIKQFESSNYFKVDGIFQLEKPNKNTSSESLKAQLDKNFTELSEAELFIEDCQKAKYTITSVKTTDTKRKPSPPFTTSSLQQEASSKIGYSPKRTMQIAQRLYEGGHITYMRTDSVMLAEDAIEQAREKIVKDYGEKYSNVTRYKNKKKSSQEAHEACRPCNLNVSDVTSKTDIDQGRLYKLIWMRTMASQMSPAEVQIKTVKIGLNNRDEVFIGKGEEIKFDGFLAVWNKGKNKNSGNKNSDNKNSDNKNSKNKNSDNKNNDEDEDEDEDYAEDNDMNIFKKIKKGQIVYYQNINAMEKLTKPPHGRFTEASLVKKLEDLEIGRPSTYASIVSTIQNRQYVERRNQEGTIVEGTGIHLIYPDKVTTEQLQNKMDAEKNKLFPTELGSLVCEYLVDNFDELMAYKFTANVENMLDEIAQGNKIWHKVIGDVYQKFNPIVEKICGSSGDSYERILGQDPETGRNIVVLMARYGPVICLSHPDDKKQHKYVNLDKNMIQSVTYEIALQLLKYPYNLGKYKNDDVYIKKGANGFYLSHGKNNYSLYTNEGEYNLYDTINLKHSIKYIEEKEKEKKNNSFKEYDDGKIKVLNGRYGPYIAYNMGEGKKQLNVTIPKTYDPTTITKKECMELIDKKINRHNDDKKQMEKQKKKASSKLTIQDVTNEKANKPKTSKPKTSKPKTSKPKTSKPKTSNPKTSNPKNKK